MIIAFWTLAVTLAFAIALAAQMRMIISVALRRALAANFGGYPNDAAYRAAVYNAGRRSPETPEAVHLSSEYPNPLAHLALARRTSLIAPGLLLLVVLAGRFVLGVI